MLWIAVMSNKRWWFFEIQVRLENIHGYKQYGLIIDLRKGDVRSVHLCASDKVFQSQGTWQICAVLFSF